MWSNGGNRATELLWLCLAILLLNYGKAEGADSVWVSGVRAIGGGGEIVIPSLCLQPQRWYRWAEFRECTQRDSLLLLRWAQGQGYWFACVDLAWDSGLAQAQYVLRLGERVRIRSLAVRCLPDTPEVLAERLHWIAADALGGVAAQSWVEAFLDSLVAVAEAAGYPAAQADVANVRLSGTQAELDVVLQRGEPARADTLLFVGVQRTRYDFLQRWSGIKPRQVLSEEALQGAYRSLQLLPWIELTEFPRRQRLPDGRWAVLFTVREGTATAIDGLVGYAPSAGGRGSWSGVLQARLGNLFGSGRSVFLRWHRTAGYIQELALQYEEPFPPVLLFRGRYEMRQQDTTYTSTSWEGGVRWLSYLTLGWYAELFGGRQQVEPSGAVSSMVSSTTWYLGGSIVAETVRIPSNPTEGILFRLSPSYRWQRLMSGQRRFRVALENDVEYFISLFVPLVFRVHGHGRLLWGAEIRGEEFYPIGGVQSLRGYREAQFLTPRAVWAGVEGRWLLNPWEYLGFFLDRGWLAHGGWRTGMGIQCQVRTAIGLLQLQLGWGKDDTVGQGKLGVRIVSTVP
ncbi:MAG: hypothetical protein RMJ46_03150 [Bacteroidota bacterium]|nr:hypothetical protein [Bacteroidota bacterium]